MAIKYSSKISTSTKNLLRLLSRSKPPVSKKVKEEQTYDPQKFNREVLPASDQIYKSTPPSTLDINPTPELSSKHEKDIEQLILELKNQLTDLKDLIK